MSALDRAKVAVDAALHAHANSNLYMAAACLLAGRITAALDHCVVAAESIDCVRASTSALCRAAAAACVDAWEASRTAVDRRQEALSALDAMRTLIGIDDPVAAAALDDLAALDRGIDTMLRGIREDEVPEVKAACYRAVVALIRWREAKEAARG